MTNRSLNLYPILANKADKKSILRFYKDNHYSARFIGYDSCYLIKENDNIIASVIISLANEWQQIKPAAEDILPEHSQDLPQDKLGVNPLANSCTNSYTNSYTNLQAKHVQKKPQYLLHALLVAPDYRKLGYAEHLVKYTIAHHQPLVCFAQASLSRLYLKSGFTLIVDYLLSKRLNPALLNRLQQYSKHKPELKAFINQKNTP